MKTLLTSLALLLTLLVIPTAAATSYYEDQTGLLFSIPDQYTIRDVSAENRSPTEEKVVQIEQNGSIVFEISISSDALPVVLERVQLRTINAQQLVNRDLLGVTGIEVIGVSFVDNQPRRAFIFPSQQRTVTILSLGSTLEVFEQLLESLQKTRGFSDTIAHPLNPEIAQAAERKIFGGYQENGVVVFKPNQVINRAEFLKVLVLSRTTQEKVDAFYKVFKAQLLKDDQSNPTKRLLSDVDRDAWFAPFIFYAFDQGWVQGYPDGTFKPGNPLNIAEISKILLSARKVSVQANAAVWFEPYVRFFSEKNVVEKRGEQYRFVFTDQWFFPYETCSRAQAAAFLSRLAFLDEHPEASMFGRFVPSDGLGIRATSEDSLILQLGKGTAASSHDTYLISGEDSASGEVHVFYPEVWTELERKGELRDQSLVYLGENKSMVYAIKSICGGDQDCVSEAREGYSVGQQDLMRFEDLNLRFSFLHHAGLQFEKSLDNNLQTLILKREDGSQLLILSYFTGQSSPFEAKEPLSRYVIGNREWKAYVEVVRGVSRLSLTTNFGTGTMVASVPGQEKVVNVDPKVFRVLRSLEGR